MGITYRYAPEIEEIAKGLIRKYHQHLQQLAPTEMRYVFRSSAAKKQGKIILGKAKKVAGFNAFLADECAPTIAEEAGEPDPIFVIEVAADHWELLSPEQRRALVDHELTHCRLEVSKEGAMIKVIAPHDVEEFTEIIERHGLWKPDVKDFVIRSARAHPSLFDEPDISPAATYADEDLDEHYVAQAADLVVRSQLGSVVMLQQKLRVSFDRAERIMALLESRGVVGPDTDNYQPRPVLMTVEELEVLQDGTDNVNVISINRADASAILQHGSGVLMSTGTGADDGTPDPMSAIAEAMLEPGFAEEHLPPGATVERTPGGVTVNMPADAFEKVPHTMSPIQGQPCSADVDAEYDHRDCTDPDEEF